MTQIKSASIYDSLVCIDSDGCVFDTMEIKQKQCIQPAIVSHWSLEQIRKIVLQTGEFVNLYSKWRGTNRFKALILMFDLLRTRQEVMEAGVKIPQLTSLRQFVNSGLPLGNDALEQYVSGSNDTELVSILKWSNKVNEDIKKTVEKVSPFPWAIKALEQTGRFSITVCVSQTPREALIREWSQHGLDKLVSTITGQEDGTKQQQIKNASKIHNIVDNIIVVGDSLNDMAAAKLSEAQFFPILPGSENESWKLFCNEAYNRFISGQYSGEYENSLIDDFSKLLPSKPEWKQK